MHIKKGDTVQVTTAFFSGGLSELSVLMVDIVS
jgi:hypothetical protein